MDRMATRPEASQQGCPQQSFATQQAAGATAARGRDARGELGRIQVGRGDSWGDNGWQVMCHDGWLTYVNLWDLIWRCKAPGS